MFMDQYIRSKSSFMLGLVSGVAIVSLAGFLVFGGLFVRRELSGGAADSNNAEIAADNNNNGNNAPTQNNKAAQPDASGKVDVKVGSADHIRGNKNAKITIVEFSDYQCPFCSRFHATMKQVMAKYPTQVRWVFKHFPLDSIHPYARKAAIAAECAGEQNKFWEYTDEIYANQASLNEEYLTTAAKNTGLNVSKFASCVKDGKYDSRVNADLQQGQNYGVRGTPGSFLNGTTIPGAVPLEQIEAMIKPLL